jgi:hypothetical protein
MAELDSLYRAAKAISVFPGWSKPEEETSYIWFDAPLEIEGITEHGLFLHGGCFARYPDCNVSLEIRISKSAGRRCTPLGRVDWRSLEGGHSNIRISGHRLSGHRLPETHFHAFDLNWLPQQSRMRKGNLRMAQLIDEDLQSFESMRSYAGKCFRINNIEVVARPEWEYTLGLF